MRDQERWTLLARLVLNIIGLASLSLLFGIFSLQRSPALNRLEQALSLFSLFLLLAAIVLGMVSYSKILKRKKLEAMEVASVAAQVRIAGKRAAVWGNRCCLSFGFAYVFLFLFGSVMVLGHTEPRTTWNTQAGPPVINGN